MTKLKSPHVTNLNTTAGFMQKIAEEIQDSGFDLDTILRERFRKYKELDWKKIAQAFVDPIFPLIQTFEIQPSKLRLEELAPGLSTQEFPYSWDNLKARDRLEDSSCYQFHLYYVGTEMSIEQCQRFMQSRELLLPSLRELCSIPESVLNSGTIACNRLSYTVEIVSPGNIVFEPPHGYLGTSPGVATEWRGSKSEPWKPSCSYLLHKQKIPACSYILAKSVA